jgi:hypothetical protein
LCQFDESHKARSERIGGANFRFCYSLLAKRRAAFIRDGNCAAEMHEFFISLYRGGKKGGKRMSQEGVKILRLGLFSRGRE